MKNLTVILLFVSLLVNAQSDLKFDKRNVQCEDKWIAKQMNEDSAYVFGFIYIDSQAGLTFNYEGRFKIINNKFVRQKEDKPSIKVRLEPQRVAIAEIPEDRFNELGISKTPEWLKYYKEDENSIARLYRWGYMYNGWGECAKALTFLEKAEKINPDYKGLAVELAFSYNCLEQYEKAILSLQNILKSNPSDAYANKELIYAQMKSGQLDKAAASCANAIKNCRDKTYNDENCYNILHSYYQKNDKANFYLWLKRTKKWTSKNEFMTESIKMMEGEMSKQ